jgi:hypothetical protein
MSDTSKTPAEASVRAARRPALCQRQHPHRPRAEQDPQGHRHRSLPDARLRRPTTCPAGTATACRSSGRSRSSTAPRARTRTRCRSTSSARNAAPSRTHWIDVQREEFKRLGVEGDWANPYTTMNFHAEAQIAGELMKFAARPALSRLQAGDVVGGREDRAGRGRGRVSRGRERHDLGEAVSGGIYQGVRPAGRDGQDRAPSASSSSSGRPRPGRSPATARSPILNKIAYGLYEVTARRRTTGRRSATS